MTDNDGDAGVIEAYCTTLSTVPGGAVGLCVSSTSPSFDVDVHRWGAIRELVWSARGVAGGEQPTPPDAAAKGCGWVVSLDIPVGDWSSGFYLVTLRTIDGAAEGAEAHACFVVRAGGIRRQMLLVLSTNTWNAYNGWGGPSLYTGGHEVSFQRPWARGLLTRVDTERDDRNGRPRRAGEAPDVRLEAQAAFCAQHGYPGSIGSTGWFTHERRFVEWAESAGFEFDMATSSDLELVDGLVDGYRLVVGVGHDEYWSAAGRDTIERFIATGGDYASFSGNTMFWQVRLERDGASMVCFKRAAPHADPVASSTPTAITGMWCDPMVQRSERRLLGASSMYGLYARFGFAAPRGVPGFVVYRPDHWMLEGTGLRYGDMLGADDAVVGYECLGTRVALDDINLPYAVTDPAVPHDAVPPNTEIVALTPASNLAVGEDPKPGPVPDAVGDLEYIAERVYGGGETALAKVRHGNAVMLTCRPFGDAGGMVTTVGTTDWVFGLADAQVAAVTANILRYRSTVD